MHSPEQELFDYFYAWSLKQGYNTYDYLPLENEEVTYPIVVLNNVQTISESTATSLNGHLLLTMDIWGSRTQRLLVSTMADRFFHASIGRINAKDYIFYGNPNDQQKELSTDQSVPNSVFQRANLTLNLQIM